MIGCESWCRFWGNRKHLVRIRVLLNDKRPSDINRVEVDIAYVKSQSLKSRAGMMVLFHEVLKDRVSSNSPLYRI